MQTNRSPIFVTEEVWKYYHRRRVEIAREWPAFGHSPEEFEDGTVDGMIQGRRAARAELDSEVIRLASYLGAGSWLVPVGPRPTSTEP